MLDNITYMITIRTRKDFEWSKIELNSFEEFYNWFIEYSKENANREEFLWYRNAKFETDIVKNRFITFYNKHENKKVSTRLLANSCKTHNANVLSTQFYLEKGWTEEEALAEIKRTQTQRALKSAAKMTDDRLPTQLNYWIKQGYSEEEAKKLQSKRQTTFTLEKCIKKYGEVEGRKRFEERQRRWVKSIFDSMSKNGTCNNTISRESLKLFEPIYNGIKNKYTCYIGLKDENISEFRISYYSYDFTIKELNLIFEYNGEAFHPNPAWDKERWDNWRQAFTEKTANEYHTYYMQKIKAAENCGFKVIQLWSSETMENNTKIIMNAIQAKIGTP